MQEAGQLLTAIGIIFYGGKFFKGTRMGINFNGSIVCMVPGLAPMREIISCIYSPGIAIRLAEHASTEMELRVPAGKQLVSKQ